MNDSDASLRLTYSNCTSALVQLWLGATPLFAITTLMQGNRVHPNGLMPGSKFASALVLLANPPWWINCYKSYLLAQNGPFSTGRPAVACCFHRSLRTSLASLYFFPHTHKFCLNCGLLPRKGLLVESGVPARGTVAVQN